MRAKREGVFSLSLLSRVCILSCALLQLSGGLTQAPPLLQCSSSNGSVVVCSWSRDDFHDPDVTVGVSDVTLTRFGEPKSRDFDSSCSTNVSSGTASCTIWGYRDGCFSLKDMRIKFLAVFNSTNITETFNFTDAKGGLTHAPPHLQCSSSNGYVVVCSWSCDAFHDPDVTVGISDVSLKDFGNLLSRDFDSSCSTNISSGTTSCTIWVYRGKRRYCLKEIWITFSAVFRSSNFTETLMFKDDEVTLSPPSNIIATANNFRELTVQWNSPADSDPLCARNYFCVHLQYSPRHANTWLTGLEEGTDSVYCDSGRDENIVHLTPGTFYDIRMRARVRLGANYGPWSENITAFTLQEAPTGLVSHIEKSFQRIGERMRRVNLTWNGLDVQTGSLTGLYYVIHLEPSLGYNYTTNRTSFTIEGLDVFSAYDGWIWAENSAGSGPSKVFHIPDRTAPPEVPEVNYNATSTSIDVTILPPDQPNGAIIKYEIWWKGLADAHDAWHNVTFPWTSSLVIQHIISPLKPDTSYEIKVKVFNVRGSSVAPEIIHTPMTAPSIAPSNFIVDTVSGEPDVVKIEWTHLQEGLDMSSGYIVHYCALNKTLVGSNSSCYEGSEETTTIDRRDNGASDSPFLVRDLKPFTWYSFRLQLFNDVGFGPISEPVLVQSLQAAPSPPVDMNVSFVASSPGFINVTWSQPLVPNGIIVHYVISYNTDTIQTNATYARVKVFGDMDYVVGVRACTQPDTEFACSDATIQRLRIPVLAPSSPHIKDLLPSGPGKIRVRWDPPLHPNGPVEEYVIKLWSTSTAGTAATVTIVDGDQREEEVMVECDGDTGADKGFQIEIFARTVNEDGVKLDGGSDARDVTMCGVSSHVSAVMVALPISLAFLVISCLLAGLVYIRCFRLSSKLDIYSLDMLKVRKKNKRFQHLRIPKPTRQENEVFDAIRTRPYVEVKPDESLDDKSPSRMPTVENRASDDSLSQQTDYLLRENHLGLVIPNHVVPSRQNPCDNDDDVEDCRDNQQYSHDSSEESGYKSLHGHYIPMSLDQNLPMIADKSRDDVYCTAESVPGVLPKNSHEVPKNSHVTRSMPNVGEQLISTSQSVYHRVNDAFAPWSNARHTTVRDITSYISSVQLMDKHRQVPVTRKPVETNGHVYCTLASLGIDEKKREVQTEM